MNPFPFAVLVALTAGAGGAASAIHPGELSVTWSELSHTQGWVSSVREGMVKCNSIARIPGHDPRTYLVVLDGEVSARQRDGEAQGTGIEPEEVSMIQIGCWSPEVRRFVDHSSGDAGQRYPSWPVLIVQSRSAFDEAAASLTEVVSAQEAHFRMNERFATTLEELEPFGLGSQDGVEFTVAEGSWTAETFGHELYDRCSVGSLVSGSGREGRLEPTCDWSEDAVSDAVGRWISALEDGRQGSPSAVDGGLVRGPGERG